jgi:hypothetical protein
LQIPGFLSFETRESASILLQTPMSADRSLWIDYLAAVGPADFHHEGAKNTKDKGEVVSGFSVFRGRVAIG